MATWDDVRAIALALPEVEESTSYRQPSFKVRGKAFATMSPHEDGALVLRCDREERPLLLETSPDAFYVTPHYAGHSYVLARLDVVAPDELAGRIEDSWLLAAPPSLAGSLERD